MTSHRSGFLLLHGWENRRPESHWQHRTAAALREGGRVVEYPQLPSPDEPVVADWSTAASDALGRLADDGAVDDVVVIAHSLAVLLWLGARPESRIDVSRVLLVAPPSRSVVAGFPEITAFAAVDPVVSARDEGRITLVGSDDDPFSPEGAFVGFGRDLGIPTVMLSGQGHVIPETGYGSWPSLLEWCVDPGAEIIADGAGPIPPNG